MEPRREHNENTDQRAEAPEPKPRRFRIVKLEERIAPGNGNGMGSNFTCKCYTNHKCGC